MKLSPGAVDAYKKLMTDPKTYGMDFEPLSEVFKPSDEATAKHLLYEQYLVRINKTKDRLPKVFFYIIMDELYPQKKAADGNLGYCVSLTQLEHGTK